MKKRLFYALSFFALLSMMFAADGYTVSGYKGAAQTPPKVEERTDDTVGAYSHVEAVADGAYQAVQVKFKESVELSEYKAMEFWFRHKVVGTSQLSLVVHFRRGDWHIHTIVPARVAPGQWLKVTVPFKIEEFKGNGREAVFEQINEITITPYEAFNAVGKYMDVADIKLIPLEHDDSAAEKQPSAYDGKITISGYKGGAIAPPSATNKVSPKVGPYTHLEAVESGKYQAIQANFSPDVDLSKCSGIEFWIRHNVIHGKCSLVVHLRKGRKQIYTVVTTPSRDWNKILVPLEAENFKAEGGTAIFGNIDEMSIAPYDAFNAPGKFMDIAALRFVPKQESEGRHKVNVQSYEHRTKPTSGDDSGKALTDGDLKSNVFFRPYAEIPDIVFDLGAKTALDEIKVNAFAAPSHNFSAISVFSSYDKKDWMPVGTIKNGQNGIEPMAMECAFAPKNAVVGRYFRLQPILPRTDYSVNISEVTFFGHTPTEKEIAAAAEVNYDTGLPMPERGAAAYHEITKGDWRFYVSKTNGVINGVFYKDKLLFERVTPKYTLQTRAKDTDASGYDDVVKKAAVGDGAITLTLQNPKLTDVTIERIWQIDGNALLEKVAVLYGKKERFFLRLATEVICEQQFRKDGFYEMPSSAIATGMYRLQASDVRMDRALTNIPMIAFDNGKTRQVVWHYRHRFNGRFTYYDVGTEEENLQVFKPNGWSITAATIVPADVPRQTFENRLSITDGGMLKAYDEYLKRPEVAEFRNQIKRPDWVRDMRVIIAFGWDGNYPESSKRLMKNYQNAFSHRGYLHDAELIDADGIWGDLVVKGPVRGSFGDCRDATVLRQRLIDIHNTDPRFKVGIYTWFWSAFPWSTPVKNHPEWFVKKLRNGASASWFPGVNTNYLRFFGIKESRDEAVRQIGDFVRYYNQCGWYADGGKSGPYAKDWETMRIDDPLGQTDFYLAARNEIQKDDPSRSVNFNHSENPIGDIGQLESSGGVLTGEWRRGAILMWKFKMWNYRDPLHQSVYTYWLPAIDGVFHNYMVGTGVTGNLNSHNFTTRDLPYLGARYDVRLAEPADANVSPDWRYDYSDELECNTLRQMNNGWIFMQYHGDKPAAREVAADLRPLGIDKADKPVYAWLYKIRRFKDYNAIFGEPQIEKAYAATGWVSERAVTSEYLGKLPWKERFSLNVPQENGQGYVVMFSQIPAVVLSIENDPVHFLLSGQPGISIAEKNGAFAIDSEFEKAEIGLILDEGMMPKKITVNGKAAKYNLRVDRNLKMAVVTVGKGKSSISMESVKAKMPVATSLDAKVEDGKLIVNAVPADAQIQIYNEGALALSRSGSFSVALPETARDGEYEITSGAISRKVTIKGFAKPLKFLPLLVSLPAPCEVKAVNKTVKGIEVLSTATLTTEGCTKASVDVDALRVDAGTIPYYESHYNVGCAALEIKAKRYMKLRIHNGVIHHSRYGYQPTRHFVRLGDPHCFAGIMLDFGTLSGYSVRSAAGFGEQTERRRDVKSKAPEKWGTKKEPQHIYALTRTLYDTENETEDIWIDLKQLGAPANWDGRLWLTSHTQNFSPDRTIGIQILDCAAELPKGAELKAPIELGGKVEQTFYDLRKCNGKPDWGKLPVIGQLVPADANSIPLKTAVKAACDDKNLYFHYECDEKEGHILVSEGGKSGKPWEGDGVEFFVRFTSQKDRAFHVIMDAGCVFYIEDTGMIVRRGEKRVVLENPGVTGSVKKTANGWEADVVLPWSAIGGKPQGGPLPFNMMRNRFEGSRESFYTLSPDGEYFSNLNCQFNFK